MLVRRVIEKEVTCCKQCPYYREDHDMGSTIPSCEAIVIKKSCWETVLNDINWQTVGNKISSQCPLTK